MKNKIIFRILYSIIMILISFIIFEVAIFTNYNHHDYIFGFGVGFLGVSIVILIKNILALRNPKKLKKIEVVEKDERLIKITNNSYAMTFRITIFTEAIISIISTLLGNFDISRIIGVIICLQLMIFFITYMIISKKN